jgi:hypothetical protein
VHLSIALARLRPAVRRLSRLLPARGGPVLFEAEASGAFRLVYAGERWRCAVSLPAHVVRPGAALVPASALAHFGAGLPAIGWLELVRQEKDLLATAPEAGYRFELAIQEGGEVPVDPGSCAPVPRTTFLLRAGDFLTTLRRTAAFAAAARYQSEPLRSISRLQLIFTPSRLRLTATDGFRLARAAIAYEGSDWGRSETVYRACVPAEEALRLARFVTLFLEPGTADRLVLTTSPEEILFQTPGPACAALRRQDDPPYPGYRHLLARTPTQTLLLDRDALLSLVAHLAACWTHRPTLYLWAVPEGLVLSDATCLEGKTRGFHFLPGTYRPAYHPVDNPAYRSGHAPPAYAHRLAINGRFLLEALRALGPGVTALTLAFLDPEPDEREGEAPLSLGLPGDPDFTHLIMPIRAAFPDLPNSYGPCPIGHPSAS